MKYMVRLLHSIIFLVISIILTSQSSLAKSIVVDIDFMRGLEFEKPAGQIILGNPIIADITVRDDKFIFISGKSPGRTNMLVYGRDGQLAEQYILVVRDPNTYLTVYQGSGNKSHFDCEPLCQRVLRIEDRGQDAEAQRGRISAQIEMIDSRARQAKSAELLEQQQRGQ
ncbi:MAG: Flp pilus assembly secretin CpaC [Alphaproteobacteria bacterium]|jgi:Flp pilus assembly secretin CpaC